MEQPNVVAMTTMAAMDGVAATATAMDGTMVTAMEGAPEMWR